MQDSLPAAGPALPGGIGYPQGSCERFHGCDDSPFPSFLARCQFIILAQKDELTPNSTRATPDYAKRRTDTEFREKCEDHGELFDPLNHNHEDAYKPANHLIT